MAPCRESNNEHFEMGWICAAFQPTSHSSVLIQQNVRRMLTIRFKCIELAYALGIPTIRVNTGRWGTSKNFDELMANKGIEPRLEGYTDDQGFAWVEDGLQKCLPVAEKCGVVLGLENHWGLGRTAEGVLRVINAIESPWLRATLDTGNFLEKQYEQYAQNWPPKQSLCRRKPILAAVPGIPSISTMSVLQRYCVASITAVTFRWSSRVRKSTRQQFPRASRCYARHSHEGLEPFEVQGLP